MASAKGGSKRGAASILADTSHETERNTRPRVEESAAAVATAPTAPPRWLTLSPAQRCFSDGLALVFAHLTLASIVSAARSCKSWYEGAKRVKASSLGAGVDSLLFSARNTRSERLALKLPNLISSPLRHLVRTLHGSFSSVDNPYGWGMRNLKRLHHLPHLTSICLPIRLSDVVASKSHFSFPAELVEADLSLVSESGDEDSDSLAASRCVLEALVPCTSLTKLTLKLSGWAVEPWDLSPLLQLTRLRDLSLSGGSPYMHYASEEVVAVLRQLVPLQRLALESPEDDSLDEVIVELCRLWRSPLDDSDGVGVEVEVAGSVVLPLQQCQCHQLQWLDAPFMGTLEVLTALGQSFPSLTHLAPVAMSAQALPALSGLSNLREVDLTFEQSDEESDGHGAHQFDERGFLRAVCFIPHLACGASLRTLSFTSLMFNEAEAEALCHLMPPLRSLSMREVCWPSLHPLRHLSHLTALALHNPSDFTFELAHLQVLQSLHMLKLTDIEIGAETLASLHPPSALLPLLTSFEYQQSRRKRRIEISGGRMPIAEAEL